VKGVTKSGGASASSGIGGMVLVTSTGFPRLLSALEPGHLDDRDLRRRHRHGARLRLHVGAACVRSRSPASVGRKAGERTVARANPRKVETCKVPVVFDPRVSGSLVGHLVGAVNGASIARKTSFPEGPLGRAAVRGTYPHHRRSPCACAACARRPSTPKGVKVRRSPSSTGRADLVAARLRHRARLGMATTGHAHRGVSSRRRRRLQSAYGGGQCDARRVDLPTSSRVSTSPT
jgi:PmbA protein